MQLLHKIRSSRMLFLCKQLIIQCEFKIEKEQKWKRIMQQNMPKCAFQQETENNQKENKVTKEIRFSHSAYDRDKTVATVVKL